MKAADLRQSLGVKAWQQTRPPAKVMALKVFSSICQPVTVVVILEPLAMARMALSCQQQSLKDKRN